MCLIAFALGQNPHFPLVVAANRDEFFRRPTAAMDWWTTDSGTRVLAGRDLLSGGTWLAVNAKGEVSAVTNVREGTPETGRISRGELPLRALTESREQLEGYLLDKADQFSGFNLVRLSTESGWYFSNRDAHPGRHVHRGVYGLSNHLLQTPWPKLLRLRESAGEIIGARRPERRKAAQRPDSPASGQHAGTGPPAARHRRWTGDRAFPVIALYRRDRLWHPGNHRGDRLCSGRNPGDRTELGPGRRTR